MERGMSLCAAGNREEPIVPFPCGLALVLLIALDDAYELCQHHATRVDWCIEQDDDIERIAVIRDRLRDEAEVEREQHSGGQHAVESVNTKVFVELELVA